MNAWIAPQLVSRAPEAPEGAGWVHEVKYDGYRLHLAVAGGEVRLYTRNGHDWTERLPEIAAAAAHLPDCYLDGELSWLEADGRSDFHGLQRALAGRADRDRLHVQVFDCLGLAGADLRTEPLLERKAVLEEAVADAPGRIRFTGHITGRGPDFFRQADALDLEGIVSKRVDSRYAAGVRSTAWVKVKCFRRFDLLLVGYTRAREGGVESLLLAEEGPDGLRYVGRVEFGLGRGLLGPLGLISSDRSPVRGLRIRNAHWVEPRLMAHVKALPMGPRRRLRHAYLKGLSVA